MKSSASAASTMAQDGALPCKSQAVGEAVLAADFIRCLRFLSSCQAGRAGSRLVDEVLHSRGPGELSDFEIFVNLTHGVEEGSCLASHRLQ